MLRSHTAIVVNYFLTPLFYSLEKAVALSVNYVAATGPGHSGIIIIISSVKFLILGIIARFIAQGYEILIGPIILYSPWVMFYANDVVRSYASNTGNPYFTTLMDF